MSTCLLKMPRNDVCPFVRPSVPAWAVHPAAAGLLLWARRARDIDRLLQQKRALDVCEQCYVVSERIGSWKQKQTGKLPSCRSSTEAHNVLTTCPRSLCESKTPESRQLQVQRVHITIDALSCPCCTRRFRFRQTHTLEWLWNWIGASELGTLCTDSSYRGRCKV